MTQEYLFADDSKKETIKGYTPKQAEKKIVDITNSPCWILTISHKGENEDSAKILSNENDYIINNFSPTVLSNGSSAYFNKALFPYVNEFERLLRKLLYIKAELSDDKEKAQSISNLEDQDLGAIFFSIFTDKDFIANVKQKIAREYTWPFSKGELVSKIEALPERTLWDELIGKDAVPALRNNFLTVKDYRNDVMHAHNINR